MGMRPPLTRVDADAVCARCGTVNPEDTLICKVCGNNLRDQRTARFSREMPMVEEPKRSKGRFWFTAVLAMLGGLVVLVVLVALPRIEQGLAGVYGAGIESNLLLWSGPDGEKLSALAGELNAKRLSDEEVQSALTSPAAVEEFSGRFVLAVEDADAGLQQVGEALVQQEEDFYYFVARVGITEVRGKARLNSNNFLVAEWVDQAGYRVGSEEHQVAGAVGPLGNAVLDGFGKTDLEEDAGYAFLAFHVAGSAAS